MLFPDADFGKAIAGTQASYQLNSPFKLDP